jgi:putative glycerol-1-phosphate prenyltransferase
MEHADRMIYKRMCAGEGKRFAVLVDPDKLTRASCTLLVKACNEAQVDFLFAGGSLVVSSGMELMLEQLKAETNIPIILFPGNAMQVSARADAILFLSLISGRNPDLLIGRHVEAAPMLRDSGLEIIPTGYMLIESGRMTTALYMSGSMPIPADKPDVAACTAMAGEMLGLKAIYLDAGSGALQPVSPEMIAAVKETVNLPLIVGGGIRTPDAAVRACSAGADIVVVGNAIEEQPTLIQSIAQAIK